MPTGITRNRILCTKYWTKLLLNIKWVRVCIGQNSEGVMEISKTIFANSSSR